MRSGAIVSAILHAVMIALTIWSLPDWFSDTEFLESEPVPVEIMTISEMTNIMATTKEDKVKPPEDPKPKPEPEKEFAALPPEDLELTEPEIAPPEPDKLPEPPPPEPVAEEKKPDPPKEVKTPTPKEKPKKKKEDFDSVLKDLLAEAPAQAEQEEPKPSDKTRKRVGAGDGLTMTETDALIGQISKCWSPPAGAPNPEQFVVTLRVAFSPDGKVRGTPEIEESNRMGEPYFRQFAEAAQRAMLQCAPYQLVIDRYDTLSEIDVVMDPSKFAGY